MDRFEQRIDFASNKNESKTIQTLCWAQSQKCTYNQTIVIFE